MLAILVSLALLIVLTFRKINIVVVGIAAAAVMALLSGQPVVTAVTDTYMTGAAQFVRDNFLLFFFSVLFGKVMEETGAAASIAKFLAELLGEKFAILGVIFSGAVLVYGGVTTLVVVFSLYPIALSLFKKANLPRYLLPGAIAGGCFTFACANLSRHAQSGQCDPHHLSGDQHHGGPSGGRDHRNCCHAHGVCLLPVGGKVGPGPGGTALWRTRPLPRAWLRRHPWCGCPARSSPSCPLCSS